MAEQRSPESEASLEALTPPPGLTLLGAESATGLCVDDHCVLPAPAPATRAD